MSPLWRLAWTDDAPVGQLWSVCVSCWSCASGHGFHEHLVQVYGFCVLEGREGIVMELCSGDLSTYLWQRTRGVAISPDEVWVAHVALVMLWSFFGQVKRMHPSLGSWSLFGMSVVVLLLPAIAGARCHVGRQDPTGVCRGSGDDSAHSQRARLAS